MKTYAQIMGDKVHWLFTEDKSVGEKLENGTRVFPPDMEVVEAGPEWKEKWIYNRVTKTASPPPVITPSETLEQKVGRLETELSNVKIKVDALEKKP
jgi:hypothetical protein